MEYLKEVIMNLSDKVNELLVKNQKDNRDLAKQIEFLKQAQKIGVINKPEYNLASMVTVATSTS